MESVVDDLRVLAPSVERDSFLSGFRCAAHWDIAFAAIADPDAALVISDESEDLAWFPVCWLPELVPAGLAMRLDAAARAIASHRP